MLSNFKLIEINRIYFKTFITLKCRVFLNHPHRSQPQRSEKSPVQYHQSHRLVTGPPPRPLGRRQQPERLPLAAAFGGNIDVGQTPDLTGLSCGHDDDKTINSYKKNFQIQH